MRAGTRSIIAFAGVWCAALVIASGAEAAEGITDVTASPPKAVAGGPLLVKVELGGRGRQASKSGKVRLRLEPKGKGKPVTLFGSPRGLSGGEPVIVPSKAKGAYELLACAGKGGCEKANRAIKVIAAKPNPLEVTPQVAPGATKSASIGPAGGTISTTAPDGSALTLSVPPDALTAAETITLSPLVGINGQPLDFVAGAELGPSGLRLAEEATLTVDPAAKVEDPIALGYSGAENEAALTPSTERSGVLSLPLTHFSGGAMIDARPAEWIKLGPYLPSSSHLEAMKRLAESLEVPGDGARAALVETLAEWYGERVKPRMELAQSSDTIFEDAVAEALAWEKFVQILSHADAFSKQIRELNELIKTAISRAFDRSVAACQGHVDVFFHARRLLFLPRLGQLKGVEPALDPGEYSGCLRFVLDVEGQLILRDWAPFGLNTPERIDSRATFALRQLPIEVDVTGTPTGRKPAPDSIEEAITHTDGNDCRFTNPRLTGDTRFGPGPQTEGTQTRFDLDPNLGQGNFLLEDRIELTGGFSILNSTLECKDGGSTYGSHGGSGTFNAAMVALYNARGIPDIDAGFPVVRDWQVFEGSALYARKQVSRSVDLTHLGSFWASATEATTWTLQHTPG